MSNAKALSLVLGLVLSSSALAAPITDGDVTLHLQGAAYLANGFYSAEPNAKVILDVEAGAGDFLLIYAVAADMSGKPDFGTLVLVHSQIAVTGQAHLGFAVPAAPAGSIILVGALVVSSKNVKVASKPLGIQIAGSEILYAPAATEPAAAPSVDTEKPPLAFVDE